ncbi:fibroleukin-like [Petaurus breviceps papuanus]|uniref:fibroleukin-like n=1 Tax=Petaurus breviceps papuanus TaxID=3040969 RepID=UPI0036DDBAAC
MKLVYFYLLSSIVPAFHNAGAVEDKAEETKDEKFAAACPVRLEASGQCKEGDECSYQMDLPSLTIQLPRSFSMIEQVFKEVQNLKETVNNLKKSCQECKLQADDNQEMGRNEPVQPNTKAPEKESDNRIKELESEVNKLFSSLKDAKDEINSLHGRLENLNLVNMNNIENYVDSKVANLTSVVNSLDGQCSSRCSNQSAQHIISAPIQQHLIYKDCWDYYEKGRKSNGIYKVTPDSRNKSFDVYCDMETMGGGWTVLQKRLDGSTNFNRTWEDYKKGFGNLSREFWLGNDNIHLLTKSKEMVLRIDLEDFKGVTLYALYDQFYVANEYLKYRLHIGNYSGTAGNALHFNKYYNHDLKFFTTPDKDNDRYPSGNCGHYYSSGWWFDACLSANLNGKYYHQKYRGVFNGIYWGTWPGMTNSEPNGFKHSFKRAKMMIRPKFLAS